MAKATETVGEDENREGGDVNTQRRVRFDTQHKVCICLTCRVAVPPGRDRISGIVSHFRKQHQLKGEELAQVTAYCSGLPLRDPHTIQLPADGSAPIEDLAVLAGCRCTVCGYLTINRKNILAHPRKSDHADIGGGWEAVELQTFSQGRFARYWVIERQRPMPRDAVVERDASRCSDESEPGSDAGGYYYGDEADGGDWGGMLTQYGRVLKKEEDERRRTAQKPGGIDHDSTWINKTGWAKHFQGRDLKRIYQLGLGPKSKAVRRGMRDGAEREEQETLARLIESFDREMSRCVGRLERVPNETLRWLNSINPETPVGQPFKLKEHESSNEKYWAYGGRYLCHCWRVWKLGRDKAQTEVGIRFTDEQWGRLCAVVEALDNNKVGGGVPGPSGPTMGRSGCGSTVNDDRRGRRDDSGNDPNGDRESASNEGGENDDDDEDEEEARQQQQQQEEERRRAVLDRRVFEFFISSIKHKVAYDVHRNPLVHFTAVLGIGDERTGHSYKRPAGYTGQLAGLVWCVRMLMLEHIFEEEPEEPEEMRFEVVEKFQEEHREWLVDGSYSPFSTMIGLMAYGKGHRKKDGGMPSVMWEENGEALRYLGQRLTIDEFRKAAQVAVREAEKLLDRLMYGQWAKAKATIELGRIVDSLTFEGAGRSFATNGRNQWLRPGHRRVAELGKAKLWRQGRGWRRRAVQQFLSTFRLFAMAMVVVTHIWWGMPGRGPEILTMRHCDSQQLIRNAFIFDGQMMLITDRDKSRAIRGIGRKVARFLPELPTKMMVAYIAWLIPTARMLQEQAGIQGPGPSLEGFLWADARKGRWDTELLTQRLRLLTAEHTGLTMGVSEYRHVGIEMGRKVRGLAVRQVEVGIGDEADGEENNMTAEVDPVTGETRGKRRFEYVFDLQSTHGSVLAQRYAVNIQFPDQLQPQMVATYREISRLWHWFLASPIGNDDDHHHHHQGCSDILGATAGKGAAKRKAVEIEAAGMGEESKKRRKVGTAEAGTATVGGGGGGGAVVGGPGAPLQQGLQRLLGEGASWKSDEQHECMVRIMDMRRGEVLICVLPTGGGKSIFFMLPAVAEETGTSIVVVPFVALMDDILDRAREDFGIDCLKWEPAMTAGRDEAQPDARLVVVSADLANSPEFISYVDNRRARGLLRRIFFDESHTAIVDASYRERLESLKGLHRYDCPVVLLTATLPVKMEKWFRRLMLAEDAAIVRASTAKLNIRYRIRKVKGGAAAVEKEVIKAKLRIEERMQRGQRGVIYCRTKKQCEALAGKLGCPFYHAGIEDKSRRRAILQEWARATGEGPGRWIVATTGLGTGIDIGGIVGVIHVEQPYGLVDFVQQTGRGGRRRGEVVDSVIVLGSGRVPRDKHSSDIEHLNRQAMEEFINTSGCRRVALGVFMDGKGLQCDEMIGAERCDRCEERAGEEGAMSLTSNRLKEHIKREAQGRRALERWLDEADGNCGVCLVKWHKDGRRGGREEEYQHRLDRCPIVKAEDYFAWRGRLDFAVHSCCWGCGLPEGWCAKLVTWKGQERCRYRDQVMPVLMVVGRSARLRRMVMEEFDIDAAEDEDKYIEWICRTRRLYGAEMTNGIAVWDLIVRQLCTRGEC